MKNRDKIIILGHENPDVDSIVSGYLLEKVMLRKGYDVEFVIPDKKIDDETISICNKYKINFTKYMKLLTDDNNKKKYILVDHNERNLDGEVVAIIDHHPTKKDINIKHYYNKRVSSTASLIAKGNECMLGENDLKLAIVATLVDTASFHSTKSTKEDELWVLDLCNKYNFNYNELYNDGLCLTKLDDLERASVNGLKKYVIKNKKIESSYIQISYFNECKIKEIVDMLRIYVINNNLYGFVFIVHNMSEFNTRYYFIKRDLIEINDYFQYTSRGNTIIPEIEKKLSLQNNN